MTFAEAIGCRAHCDSMGIKSIVNRTRKRGYGSIIVILETGAELDIYHLRTFYRMYGRPMFPGLTHPEQIPISDTEYTWA